MALSALDHRLSHRSASAPKLVVVNFDAMEANLTMDEQDKPLSLVMALAQAQGAITLFI